ncbi:MAG TPA: hypothetical protein VMV09_05065 [Candidatus Saccharimonadales bacterium]|nr:hypothetical protein [Candidatus Saccharimonadales bacterium]
MPALPSQAPDCGARYRRGSRKAELAVGDWVMAVMAVMAVIKATEVMVAKD